MRRIVKKFKKLGKKFQGWMNEKQWKKPSEKIVENDSKTVQKVKTE